MELRWPSVQLHLHELYHVYVYMDLKKLQGPLETWRSCKFLHNEHRQRTTVNCLTVLCMARTLQHSIRQAFHMMQWANIINTLIDISPAQISLSTIGDASDCCSCCTHIHPLWVLLQCLHTTKLMCCFLTITSTSVITAWTALCEWGSDFTAAKQPNVYAR